MDREIKENNVFDFSYKPAVAKDIFEPRHCFDGQLLACKQKNGEIVLIDTYWGYGWDQYNTKFSIEKAKDKGKLTFKCNLDEVDEISQHQLKYYADDDIVNLSYQHSCYKKFALKKGAKRSKEKMLKVLNKNISDAESNIKYAERTIKRSKKKIEQIEKGDMEVYI